MSSVDDLKARLQTGGEVIRLEVLDAIERLERERDEARADRDTWRNEAEADRALSDALRARIAVLQRAVDSVPEYRNDQCPACGHWGIDAEPHDCALAAAKEASGE